MAESMKPNALALARNTQFIQGRVKHCLYDFVPTERAPSACFHFPTRRTNLPTQQLPAGTLPQGSAA